MLRFSRRDARSTSRTSRIVDGNTAKAWLAAMAQPVSVENLGEMVDVLATLGAQVVDDGTSSLPPQRKFAIAERIRGVLMPLLNERGTDGRFAMLPLDPDESRHFWATVDATLALRDVYAWLVSQLADAPVQAEVTVTGAGSATSAAASGAAPRVGFVSGIVTLQRALDINAQVMVCVQRARWPVPAPIWERHCLLGQIVRDLDCQDTEVGDLLKVSATRTCRAAFVMPVLIALADPAARSASEYEVVRMGAQRWSAKVGFRLERRSESTTAPARPIVNPGPSLALGHYVLRFDTQSAIQSIDRRLEALADGKTPQEVGIGGSLRSLVARDLLLVLRQRWGAVSPQDVDSPDRAWRLAPDGLQVTAIVGLPARTAPGVDAFAGGAPRSAQNPYAVQRVRHGGITRPREDIENERIEQLFANAERWTLSAQASDAVRCLRRYPRPRIGLQRLVGLKLDSADRTAPFLIGWVEALQGSWSSGDDPAARHSVAHAVRVRLAPGLPQLLHAVVDDVDIDGAFLLVPGTTVGAGRTATFTPMSTGAGVSQLMTARDGDGWDAVRTSPRDYGLVLPHATFRPQRLIKAGRRGMVATLRLDELMMRGADFDLVRFTPL